MTTWTEFDRTGAFDKGRQSFDLGVDRQDSPYEPGTPEHEAWHHGFETQSELRFEEMCLRIEQGG